MASRGSAGQSRSNQTHSSSKNLSRIFEKYLHLVALLTFSFLKANHWLYICPDTLPNRHGYNEGKREEREGGGEGGEEERKKEGKNF